MTKSDDFFDITGTAESGEAPAAEKPREVDFDVFGEAEAPALGKAEVEDFSETAVLPNTALPATGLDFDFDVEDEPPAPAPTPAALSAEPSPVSTTPVSVETPAAGGNRKLWIGIAAAVIVASAVAWLLL
jgi:hypothetical protein